ncbi:MAG: 2-amino-4-hydroxy-6-hydroxymethyldihydropteridine diphosphokinase [Lachnospiraceae bacterium]|jgi:dihydroneopterin aldolase/2-amino-4-hydroxy-6-hydroxymethyldihydropteridine diphosphokinase|nr:2-amino-4-hydroxy-6-hydroxymethyldihydropteridine diphosphokinase [Lachnospiraceae bacterium]
MDRIHIEKLEIFARHGVCTEENFLGQKFLISADLYKDLHEAGMTDELTATVHYGKVCEYITKIASENTYKLIEKLAEEIASKILLKFDVEKVKIRVDKPWAPMLLHVDTVFVELERQWHTCYLSVGSNVGERKRIIDDSISRLDSCDEIRIVSVSDIIETKPYGFTEQPDFLNACVKIKTLLRPHELLEKLQTIESDFGRVRTVHWGPRTLDLDILFYDDERIITSDLVIPHPDMTNRYFVLEPLSKIAPFFVHPVKGETVCELLEKLKSKTPEGVSK